MSGMIQYVYSQPLNRIIIIMFLSLFIWGYLGYKVNKNIWRMLNCVLAILVTISIFAITILTRSSGVWDLVLTPFHGFIEAKEQPELYRSMLMNVFLFFYYGLTIPFVLPDRVSHKLVLSVITGLFFSIIIEFLQFAFHLGRCETDDVIMNTLGTFLGIGGYRVTQFLQYRFLEK